MCASWTIEINVKNYNLGFAYMKKICLEQKGHPPLNPSFPGRGNVSHISLKNMANCSNYKKLARLEG